MRGISYEERRGEIETYFDRTAAEAWSRLTSDAPVGRIRATVRAGRNRMRGLLLQALPDDLHGKRVLDAGCGTGALAVEAARRGAVVVAIDLSLSLIRMARERMPRDIAPGRLQFLVGDMLDPALGRFDHVVAMDSLIHYGVADVVAALAALGARTDVSLLFTFAPRTKALGLLHSIGRLFPRGDRAPAIEPITESRLRAELERLDGWSPARTQRVASGFYTSQAMELVRR